MPAEIVPLMLWPVVDVHVFENLISIDDVLRLEIFRAIY